MMFSSSSTSSFATALFAPPPAAASCHQHHRHQSSSCTSLSRSSFLPSSSSAVFPTATATATTTTTASISRPPSSTRRRARGSRSHSESHSRPTSTAPPHTRRQVFALYTQATKEERAGNLQSARNLLHQCLHLDPRDAHSWLALGRLEARAPRQSISTLLSSPQSSSATITGAVPRKKPIQLNNSISSSSSTSKITTTDDRDINNHSPSASTSVARNTFEQGLKHCPDNLHLLHAWAVYEHRTGNYHRARALFSQALDIDPGNTYVSHAWGLLEQNVGNVAKARSLYAESTARTPNAEICTAWGVLEARDGHMDVARRIFRQALDLAIAKQVNNEALLGNVYREWAIAEERLGDLPKARDLLAKAIAAQPSHCAAYIALAKLEARRGGTSRAIELARAAAEVSSKPPASVFVAWGHIEMSACKRFDEASVVFRRGLNLHPQDPALLMAFGTLQQKIGNVSQARSLFQQSVAAVPRAPTLVAWAVLEQGFGHFERARRLFEEAIATDALHGAAYNAYGLMEARIGDTTAARNVFLRGVKAAASASLFHGFALFEMRSARDFKTARQLFQAGATHSREDTSFVWHSWGIMELSQRDVEAARNVFAQGLKRYPRNSQLLVGSAMAEAFCTLTVPASCSSSSSTDDGDEDDNNNNNDPVQRRCTISSARHLFKKAVAADPTHAQAWQTWGMFELRGGRRDAAVALFRRGLRLCPRHGALWQAWGVLETGRGAFARARELFRRGLEACGPEVHLLQAWACLEVRARNIDKARQLLDQALQTDSSHGAVWNAYGVLEARHGTLARARQNFATGIKRAPRHAPLFRTFGETEMRAGNLEFARQLFEQGLDIDPRHAPLYHALAKLEGMVGNLDALAKLQKKAQSFFQTEEDAKRAIKCGDARGDRADATDGMAGIVGNSDVAVAVGVGMGVGVDVTGVHAGEDKDDQAYEARATPMELALEECGFTDDDE